MPQQIAPPRTREQRHFSNTEPTRPGSQTDFEVNLRKVSVELTGLAHELLRLTPTLSVARPTALDQGQHPNSEKITIIVRVLIRWILDIREPSRARHILKRLPWDFEPRAYKRPCAQYTGRRHSCQPIDT